MDNSENNDDYIYEITEGQFQPEFNAMQRTEYFLETSTKLIKDRAHRFKTFVGIVAEELVQQRLIKLSGSEMQELINLTSQIPSPGYKNPTAFILGYVLTKRGGTPKVFQNQLLPIINETSFFIRPHDIIRYMRWFSSTNIVI